VFGRRGKMLLKGKKVVVLAGEMYEDLELWYPYYRLKEEGAEVLLMGTSSSPEVVKSKHGYPAKIDKRGGELKADDFDAVVVPGGYGPDHLRRCKKVVGFVKDMNDKGKLLAAICHAGWVLISAGVLRGKKGTSFYAIKDDMVNAGLEWVDEEVVVDSNLITSRKPADLPAFMREIIAKLT
jgi:protease I